MFFLVAFPLVPGIQVAVLVLIGWVLDKLILVHVELLEDVAFRLWTQPVLFRALPLHPPK